MNLVKRSTILFYDGNNSEHLLKVHVSITGLGLSDKVS